MIDTKKEALGARLMPWLLAATLVAAYGAVGRLDLEDERKQCFAIHGSAAAVCSGGQGGKMARTSVDLRPVSTVEELDLCIKEAQMLDGTERCSLVANVDGATLTYQVRFVGPGYEAIGPDGGKPWYVERADLEPSRIGVLMREGRLFAYRH